MNDLVPVESVAKEQKVEHFSHNKWPSQYRNSWNIEGRNQRSNRTPFKPDNHLALTGYITSSQIID